MTQRREENSGESKTTRRDFLRYSGLAGAAAISRRLPMQEKQTAATTATRSAAGAFDLEETTLLELQQEMESGTETSRSIAEKYLARIQTVDRQGPAIRAVIELNPEALAAADALDAERRSGKTRGPLHGIPILIKDNIGTADRMTTTAGSLALAGSIPIRDAWVVCKLREAGAVLLGKTNLSEWANFRSTRSTSGWSGRGGQTRNPYALDRNPCGSSSGSSAAVAANLCAAAIGTETDGSIVCPSSANSIVGIKPTVGLVGRSGIIPIAHSQDTAGPMARTVADSAILLGAIAGRDPLDPVTRESAGKSHADYAVFLDPKGLAGARIGIPRKLFGFHDRVDQLMNTAMEAMKAHGATLIDPVEIGSLGKLDDPEYQVLLYEFKADLNAYLAGLGPGASVRSLKELIEYNERNRGREMPYFGQEIFLEAEGKGPLTDKTYRQALAGNLRLSRKEGIDAVMLKHRLDAIVAPTGGPPWPTDPINGDHYAGGCSTLAAVAGYPHITVPAGYVFGLPVGISFFGRAYSEPTLIKLAYAFEQATNVRREPQFLPTANLEG